ncbi:sugar ABC transporter substrate-binding protein [Bradyrhizobium nanningense]|uniref:Sugar ABC transporter substrate-binding protein n=1 Tax=Bradyrhizobium nanningense TaxID=1325118 RepID=A0A4Q0S5M6_9BRAD|nr:polysaccharide biosynthesis/export family protein [Bradyrhizobium nanningense]RXH25167.1 sugar ABC transporter substrate-binding protein [Bradyrhizobium nanningense]RXH30972.1 sugar ABC transporter substrate-binding protein [Bradyrhizobium nanningense]
MHSFAKSYLFKPAFLAAALALGACSTNPGSGPLIDDVNNHVQTENAPAYELVPINPATVNILHTHEPKGLAGAFTDKRPPASIVFGIGDVVSVTIFEAAAGGLFIPAEAGVRPGNYVTIPDQSVDNDGFITVPYAGQIRAAGRTAVEIQRAIVEKIGNRAIEPQAIVAMSSQRTQLISVLGEVNSPARYPASAAGAKDKVLDAITRAGGIKGQGFETWVMLERGGRRATVPFENLVMTPENNIYVRPDDSIYVYREQQKFLAFGASGQSGEFNFDAWRINLGEAVGKAGGLLDGQAEPAGVFLYRREPRDVAAQLGIDVSKYTTDTIPVIFSINMRDPGGFFLATKVMMKNQDIIYVSNSRNVEVAKFLGYLRVIMATGSDAVNLGNDALIFRNNIKLAP